MVKVIKINSDEKIYIDLDVLRGAENQRGFYLTELIKKRDDLRDIEKGLEEEKVRTEEKRKVIDNEITTFLISHGSEGMISGEELIAEKIGSRTAGKWDRDKLNKILTPTQLDEVYTEGKQYTYLRVTRNAKKVSGIREDM